MKTKSKIGLILLTLSALVLVSFINKKDEPKQKRYEVMRSVDGQIVMHDTIISVDDDLSPTDYLKLLGFDNDKHIEIIHKSSSEMLVMPLSMPHPPMPVPMPGAFGDSLVMIEIRRCDSMSAGNMPLIWQTEMSDSDMIVIEKNMVIKIDSLNNELIEMETLIETMRLEELEMIENFSGDSSVFIIQTIVVDSDSSMNKNQEQIIIERGHGNSFDFHEIKGHQPQMKFMGGQDFTLLIVHNDVNAQSEVLTEPKTVVHPVNHFQVYPNPANESVQVKLNFNDLAKTTIVVTDSKGKTVLKKDCGEIEGEFIFNMDVTKWEKGIYYIQIDRPSMKLVEKLVIS